MVTSWWFHNAVAARLVVGLSPSLVRWNGTRFYIHSWTLLGVPTASNISAENSSFFGAKGRLAYRGTAWCAIQIDYYYYYKLLSIDISCHFRGSLGEVHCIAISTSTLHCIALYSTLLNIHTNCSPMWWDDFVTSCLICFTVTSVYL